MIHELFIKLLNMSLTGGAVILAVLVLRLFLRRVPKMISYCLWAVVLFRLLCPVSFSMPVSLLGAIDAPAARQGIVSYISENTTSTAGASMELPVSVTGSSDAALADSAALPHMAGITVSTSEASPKRLSVIASYVWIAGTALMLVYGIISLALLGIKLARSSRAAQSGNQLDIMRRCRVYYVQGLPTAFVLGMIRPKIFLPEGLPEEEKKHVLLHEEIHVRRGDPVIKLVSWFTLCLHWFNPLVWVAFFLSGRDMEMSCDEAVLRKLGSDIKKDYSASLLNLAAGRRVLGGVPLAFGEGDTGSRIRNVLRYKKTTVGLVCIAVVAVVAAAVFLLANPMEKPSVYEPMGMWGTQIENLEWGMTMEEVEAYYAFSGPTEQMSQYSVSRSLKDIMELYGCEMSVSLVFEDGLGLREVRGQLIDDSQLEQLATNMQDKMDEHVTSFDREHGMSWSSERVSEQYSYEQVEEAQRQVYGELLTTEWVQELYFHCYMVDVYLHFTESETESTISIDASGLTRVNKLFEAYERELVYRQITIDDKTLEWGMSKAEVIELLGEPDEIEISEDTSASEQLHYSRAAQTDMGKCQSFVLWVDENEIEGLNGENFAMGLYFLEFHFYDMEKERALASLEQHYGSLDDPGVMIGPTLEDPEQSIYFEGYWLKDARIDEGLYQAAGIPNRISQLREQHNPDISSAHLPSYRGSLLSFRLFGSTEDNQLNLMIDGSYLILKNVVMRAGN